MQKKFEIFRELLELSHTEKRGLTFFIGGQTIAGVVERIIGSEAVIVKSQMYSKAVIYLESVDAVAVG